MTEKETYEKRYEKKPNTQKRKEIVTRSKITFNTQKKNLQYNFVKNNCYFQYG